MRTAIGTRGNLTIGDEGRSQELRHTSYLYPTRHIISLGIHAPALPIFYDIYSTDLNRNDAAPR
jgi:hypothetical protein